MTFSELRHKSRRESDYIISILLANEISLLITWGLLETKITPNQVTIASVISGLLSGICLAFGLFLPGALFLFLFHVLDCTDGNLARAKEMFSDYGRWLDFVGNRMAEMCVFLGASLYFFRIGESNIWIILPILGSLLLLLYYYIVDVALSLGISETKQSITSFELKGVHVKFGLYEPVLYGFIILAPLGFLKIQIILISALIILTLGYQLYKKMK